MATLPTFLAIAIPLHKINRARWLVGKGIDGAGRLAVCESNYEKRHSRTTRWRLHLWPSIDSLLGFRLSRRLGNPTFTGESRRCQLPITNYKSPVTVPAMTAFSAITALFLFGCARQPTTEAVTVSGGQNLRFTRLGTGFVKAESDRFVVDEAGLTTYRTEGKNFVRWQFAILPKTESTIQQVKIEDVTGENPVLILDDRAPVVEERRWTRQSDLIRASVRLIPWLFESGRTTRVFRITIYETNGKKSALYQPVLFTPKAKKDFRVLMGPETAS